MPRLDAIIDISKYQGEKIDFAKIKADGIVAVIHKATEGHSYRDPYYKEHRDLAKKNGLLWGAYHFGSQGIDGVDQANYFLDFVGDVAGDFVCLDFETYTRRHDPTKYCMTITAAQEFVNRIKATLNRNPWFYSGNTIREVMKTKIDPVLGGCKLWLAGYVQEDRLHIQESWSDWTMWQYTDGAHGSWHKPVAGVGVCDRSVFDGDDLKKVWAA
jgi:lysozyme